MTAPPVSPGSSTSYTTTQSVKDREALREEAEAILNTGKKPGKSVYKNENGRKRARIGELMTEMGKMKGDLDGSRIHGVPRKNLPERGRNYSEEEPYAEDRGIRLKHFRKLCGYLA